MSNSTVKERVVSLEVKVDTILENHLPHLDAKVDLVITKIDRFGYLLITTLVGFVVGLLYIIIK